MKKPKKIYHQKIDITEAYVLKLQDLKQRLPYASLIDLLFEFLKENDSLKQTALLKKIGCEFRLLEPTNQPTADICLEVLAEIFVILDLKNPARRTLASLFDGLPESFSSSSSTSLSSSVIRKLQEYEIQVENIELRPAINMVSSLMENFDLGNAIIKLNGIQVLSFLAISLQQLVSQAKRTKNPVGQTTIMMDCLATIKTVIAVLQKNGNQITEELQSGGCNLCLWVLQVKGIMQQLLRVLNQDFLPDCQTASGMALCLIVCLFSRQGSVAQVVLETVFPLHSERMPKHLEQKATPDWIAKVLQDREWEVPVSFNQLCLCHGVLTMIPLEDLLTPISHKDLKQTLLFDVLFPDLCQLCESLKESFSCLSAFKSLTLWTEQARRAAKLNPASSYLNSLLIGTAAIPQKLLSYVWDYWDHPIEVVRYQTKAIFEQVVKTNIILSGQEPMADGFLKHLTGKLIEVGWHSRGIYGPLCCMTSAVGARNMLGWYPCVPLQVMMVLQDRVTAPHVIDFLDVITQVHKHEITSQGDDMEEWLTTWVVPLIETLRTEGSQEEGMIIENSLSKVFKCHPGSLQFIIKNLDDKQDKHIEILITCLKTARSLGIIKVNNDVPRDMDAPAEEVLGGVVPVDWLKKALCHVEHQTRLDALGLLCDSPRTTEPISVTDLALLKVFLSLNMNNQSPSFRQNCAILLKKLLLRMKASIRISVKRLERTSDSRTDNQRLQSYQEFLHWFCEVLFASMFPGASFARRATALHYLKLLSTIFIEDRKVKEGTSAEPFVFEDVMTDNNITVLLDCLHDSYDVNKQLAGELLTGASCKSLPFQTPDTLQPWQQKISRLVSSPRAVDASTASISLKLLIDKCALPLFSESSTSDQNEHNSRVSIDVDSQAFRVICYLLSSLKTQSSVAEQSLNQASSRAPMHGLVYCLREVLGHVKLSCFTGDKDWQQLVSSLLDECFHVADLVSPVVACTSPEGHLIDEEFDDTDFTSVQDESPSSEVFNASSQVLLVCCWRTMKEVALILGDLVQNAPIRIEKSGLLTPQQVHRIGDFFTTVLLTSKHRGAFELAYTGFVKLCTVLWICEDSSLRRLPQRWVLSLISDISASVPSEVLCGTRRSAGVPFFVQAIVTTEPLSAGKACFKRLMADLIPLADQPIDKNVPEDSTLPQVHSRNILRALYRDTRLGEDVFPFVASGLMIAVRGFLSDSWAIRNSSTLLFGALMTRIFGVKKSKDEHSKRNWMTGREFFTRFPEIHFFLLEELKNATEAIARSLALDLHPSLYPVLVLLSRLYPSSMDGVDSTLSVSAFIPYVIRCGGSSVLKTRAMAARAIVPLVTRESLVQVLQDLLRSLPASLSRVDQNKMHGTLLQIQHLVREHLAQSSPPESVKDLVTERVLPLFDNIKWIADGSNPCAMTRAVFLDITFQLFFCSNWQNTGQKCLTGLTSDHVLHMRTYITHTAVSEVNTVVSRPLAVVSVGEVLVKEVCARTILRAVSECVIGRGDGVQERTKASLSDSSPLSVEEERFNRQLTTPPNHHQVIKCLLTSQDYEVRLLTLEHLNTFLSRNRCTSRVHPMSRAGDVSSNHGNHDEKSIEGLAEAMERADLTDGHLEDMAVVVLEMAMGREQHLDCLGQVYEVLALVVGYLSFPLRFSSNETVSMIECWQHVLRQARNSGQRDSVRCALVQFLASMAEKVYQELILAEEPAIKTKTRDAVLSLNELLKSTTDENQSVDVRYQTAEILGNGSLSSLLWDPSKQLGYSSLDLWSVVISLLHDDDSSVRDCMTSVLTIPTVSEKPVTTEHDTLPQLALEIVLDRVWREFYIREPCATLQWILQWITASQYTRDADTPIGSCTNHNAKIDLLFEKNSLNSYQENEIISQVAFRTLTDHQTEITVAGNDVSDYGTKKALEELQKILQETDDNFLNLFLRIYFSVKGLTAAQIIRIALFKNDSRINNCRVPESGQNWSNIPPIGRNGPLNQEVETIIAKLCSRLQTSEILNQVVAHPLTRNAVRELCVVYNIDISLE